MTISDLKSLARILGESQDPEAPALRMRMENLYGCLKRGERGYIDVRINKDWNPPVVGTESWLVAKKEEMTKEVDD